MDDARMTRLLVRIAGLFILVFAIGNMPTAFVRLFERNGQAEGVVLVGILAGMFLPVALGLLLYVCAGPITARVFAAPVESGPSEGMARIESAALFVLGCYLMCYAIFDVAYVFAKISLYRLLASDAPYGRGAPMLPADFALLCANIVKFVVALGIIAFSRGIVASKDRLLSLRGPLHGK